MRKIIMLALIGSTIIVAPPVEAATHQTACEKAFNERHAVIKKHGKRAPGRQICRFGVRHSDGSVTKATYSQKKRYLFALRRMNIDSPYIVAGKPHVPPAGTATPRAALPACTWVPESGGNYHAYNPSSGAAGKYQIIPSTWESFGGTRFAPSAGQASPAEQDIIATRIAADGLHHWVNC